MKVQDAVIAGPMLGELESCPLTEILMWLHRTERSGTVRVSSGLTSGAVHFRNGHLFSCDWGYAEGELALASLLTLERGRFSVSPSEGKMPQQNIHEPTGQIIHRWSHSQPVRLAG